MLASFKNPTSGFISNGGMRTPNSSSRAIANTNSDSPTIVSDFDMSRMPTFHKRTQHPWSVHYSSGATSATKKYIATLRLPDSSCSSSNPHANNNGRVRHASFAFATEREARKFCKAYSPPKMVQVQQQPGYAGTGGRCMLCETFLATTTTTKHCRNCGCVICEKCSRRWALPMIPKTFYQTDYNHGPNPMTVRVCKSCDWLSNAFCLALLQGRYRDVLLLAETNNLNLRSTFASIHREAMFPVHCAVMGGSLDLVRWLVEAHMCPLSVRESNKGQMLSVQTSASRTLMDLAMSGRRPKIEILLYLVSKGLSIHDVKDTSLAPKTLEAMLKVGVHPFSLVTPPPSSPVNTPDTAAATVVSTTVAIIEADRDHMDESVTTTPTIDDPCVLCYERNMDCVLIPCGHQICCIECGQQVETCPICKVSCSVLKVFRQ